MKAELPDVLNDDLEAAGLTVFGAFHPDPGENIAGGRMAGTVVLVGNAGPAMWEAFLHSPFYGDGKDDPLDRWTRDIIDEIATRHGTFTVAYPFGGPPHHPFQQWAERADGLRQSPLGILISPEFGLWHAYRAALIFRERLPLHPIEAASYPCDDCRDRPCLSACPVGAFTEAGYEVGACAAYLETSGGAGCLDGGCLARNACPVGAGYRYREAELRFLMSSFRKARRKTGTTRQSG